MKKNTAASTSAATSPLASLLLLTLVKILGEVNPSADSAGQVIVEQSKFYHQDLHISYQILLTISTQVLGYAIAGITRNYLVRPSGMIWPGTLVSTAMFGTLHKEENKPANGWIISRSKFFLYVFAGSVAFYFLPGLLMPALSYFSVVTWFAPDNVVVANFVSNLPSVRV
jgi:hypothetical protein